MDPALFRIDWDVLFEVLFAIIVLAFFVERALSILFEHRVYVSKFDKKGLKEPIALALSLVVVWYWKFDALSILMRADENSTMGYVITAAIIAGGSKASIKLFHDLIKARSTAAKDALAAKEALAAKGADQP